MASYFSHLPKIYVGQEDNNENFSYQLVSNIFRRVILEEKLEKYTNSYESFYIPEGMRPEMVAHTFYKDAELDWVILLANNIIDIYEDWPKNRNTLSQFVLEKYGDWDSTHHWETNEVKYDGAVFVKEGIEVNADFRATLPDGTILSQFDSIYPVSNIEHETYLNEKKRLIGIPNNRYVEFFKEKFASLVAYKKCAEIQPDGHKKTTISGASRYIDRATFRKSTSSTVASTGGGSEVSFNNGDLVSSQAALLQSTTTTGAAPVVTQTTSTTTTTTTSSSSSGGSGGSSSSAPSSSPSSGSSGGSYGGY
ncbi:base plate wedge component [Synechococcus phage S-MbCM6]|jgi:hypothetical protein|uniref:Baseplate wedge component n=3 Tax=Namakavirus smbcm6 TaxID=2734120 RepID=V5USJ8_9CAUD|nr:baseplate wedge component [Synechococcus phage S-MbCM25]AIX22557.1 base plate wedge component [Synechococcus phage ACG-2014c]AIX22771.1 base plate wedge component [Synechococcus phage ACG-2014c]AIX38003.1 base plate wedge component [Synechococcus phage ACG-2014c]